MSSACAATHVTLAPLPSDDAPLAERAAFYNEHKTLAAKPSRTYGGLTRSSAPYLLLEDGRRVVEPTDLLQHVPPGSPTSKAALRAAQKEDESFWWGAGAAGLFGVGTLAMVASLPASLVFEQAGASVDQTLLGSMGLVLLGGAVALVGVWPMHQSISASMDVAIETETAFAFYDRDLKRQLRLPSDQSTLATDRPPAPTPAPAPSTPELFTPDPS